MKIQVGNEPYIFRPTGSPIEGRLFVYKLGTDVKATTYTLEGTSFVQAPNPVLLHSGLPDDSLFVDVGLYTIAIEQYIGPEGQMSIDSPDEYFRKVDQYETGIDFDPQASSANVVDTIGDLENANPDLKTVTVLWHDAPGDCVPRTYYWDATAQDLIDGGYVVGSNISDTGRWILLWGDEILPASIYGVIPGREANLNLLFNYPATVGSHSICTAPCVRFTPGDYTTSVNCTTDKEIVFDSGARFTQSTITAPRIRLIGKVSGSYLGDFVLTAPDASVHSSWFRTLQSFWHCGAKYFYLDPTNYFESSVLTSNVSLAGKVVVGTGRIPCTYSSGVRFLVGANTNITGRIFNMTDYVRFMSREWGDAVFGQGGTWDPGLISAGHHVQYDEVPDLDIFVDTSRWVATMRERRSRLTQQEWSEYTLDLQGRTVNGLLDAGLFTTVRDAVCNTLRVENSGASVYLHNVRVSGAYASCRDLHVYGCDIKFLQEPSLLTLECSDSRVDSDVPWTAGTMFCTMERCRVGIFFNRVADNEAREEILRFTECQFTSGAGAYSKSLEMYRCVTDGNAFKVYPYLDNGNYTLRAVLIGNSFNSPYPVEFTKVDTRDGRYLEECYNCILDVDIEGNMFRGNDEGIRMRYWQCRSGSYRSRLFIRMASSAHSVVYSGNMGQCPAASMKGVAISGTDSSYVVEYDPNNVKIYKYPGANLRVFPDIRTSQWWGHSTQDGGTTAMFKYYSRVTSPYDSLTYDMFVQANWYAYFVSHDEAIDNGDFFRMAVCTQGDYIRIVQHGDNDRNQGVIAKIV